ncbi:lactate/malate family dehydrogenase [Mycoplasmopsis opalescens]|uniref:lactate/malate family dehydrogenase n=1 Tax=Mycoplasmopsis opalescens TaxID=114886 RepID=UPI0004A74055|nr:lactate dehydrogenase [Mycoplasmopsis opalescens]
MKKIVVIGLGNVGFTYVTICVARNIQAEWIFVDKNTEVAEAHAHDFEDMCAILPRNNSSFKVGTLDDAKGADIVMIAASIPAGKDFSDRLALAGANAKLMKSFGDKLKEVGFKGSVIVAANPCDVMAAVIHYASGLPANKVMSAGTVLDSGRMRKFVAAKVKTSPENVHGFVCAEHGGSAMIAWSQLRVGLSSVEDLIKARKLKRSDLDEILKQTLSEPFFIFSRKGNTQFGIATSCYRTTEAILENQRAIIPLGVKLPKPFKNAGIYTCFPVIVGERGYEYLPGTLKLSKEEMEKFEASTAHMANVHTETLAQIGINIDFK